VTNLFEKFMKEKVTAETISNTEAQMVNRIIPNTYQTMKRQMKSISPTNLKRQAGGQAVRTIMPTSTQQDFNAEAEMIMLKTRYNSEVKNIVESKKSI